MSSLAGPETKDLLMSEDTGSIASSDKSWLKLYAAVAVLPLVLAACGGGGGGSPAPAPTPTPTPPAPTPAVSLTVSPSATSTTPGGAAITLTATVTGSTATPTWTLTGPGTLSASTGAVVTYTPPATGVLDANSTAIVSASLTGATTQTASLHVLVAAVAGLNWQTITAPSAGNLLGVDYDDSMYVAVSDTGAGLKSADGITWTAVTPLTSNVSTDHLKAYAITHFGSTFVAAGAVSSTPYTTSTGAVATSADGTTWTMGTLPAGSTPIHGLIYGTRLVGLGETGHLYTSTNGQAWLAGTTLTVPNGAPPIGTFNAGVYGNSDYVAVGDNGYIAFSTDGITWESAQVVTANSAGVNLHGVGWTGTQFVAVGDNGAISISPDGTHWSGLQTSAITGALRAVSVSTAGTIVVVGDNGIETSTDGITWKARNDSGVAALSGVTFANAQFVAVGTSSAIKTSVSN
jgi:hypothetical protein